MRLNVILFVLVLVGEALIFSSCNHQEGVLQVEEESVDFRGRERFRKLTDRELREYEHGNGNEYPQGDFPEGTLGCWKGDWTGFWVPDLNENEFYEVNMYYDGTYHASLDGLNGYWDIPELNESGHFQVYNYYPYNDGTAALYLRMMRPDGTILTSGPWWGVLDEDCKTIEGPTYEVTTPVGYYTLVRAN